MARDDAQLTTAKRSYRNAKELGNRQEEARWANVIGDILKNRGEYVEALKWLRIDYEVSVKYLPEKQLLPTCQSLGEVYLRLEYFKDALIYQKKHLELAKDSGDLIEQQRASTQLGRTYHEMFLRSEDDHYSVRNAKKHFKSAMKLAQSLKENPPSNRSSFLKEYIDAHNNIGMLEIDLDNLEEAKKILTEGLHICDEEEVSEDNDGRSRLHHNLGNVYMELRSWDEAREHIEKDIIICKRIGHCQGEAKGFINLGELHYRVQKYEEAIRCYKKALDLVNCLEDEDAMADQINQNIETVKEAIKVLAELKQEEQNLKKLKRAMVSAKGTAGERKCLLQQNASLDRLIERSSVIFAWLKHREFAKKKKRIAHQLCDKEKLSDSFLAIGESYQKLRNFNKAFKWYKKSWESYKAIGNLEGQALAKINIGDVLDSDGHWSEALDAFEEGYRIALEAKLPRVQLSALENMHYSHMIRFDNVEEARRLQAKIEDVKHSTDRELEVENLARDCCSETDTEGEEKVSYSRSNASCSKRNTDSYSFESRSPITVDELNEDAPLSSLLQPRKPKRAAAHVETTKTCLKRSGASPIGSTKSNENPQTGSGRKRLRMVLSDDEDGVSHEIGCSHVQLHNNSAEGIAISGEIKNQTISHSPAGVFQDILAVGSKCANDSCNPVNLEESTCSFKSRNSTGRGSQNGKEFRSSTSDGPFSASNIAASSSRCDINVFGDCLQGNNADNMSLHTSTNGYGQSVSFRINNGVINLDINSLTVDGDLSIESLKVQVACLYYLQLFPERRSNGLLPIIHQMRFNGRALEPFENTNGLMDFVGKGCIEVLVSGWVQKRLIKLYVECCHKLFEAPNMKLLKKLYTLEVEDEIVVSECELQDISIVPLLDALHVLNSVAMLDLSHNLLGNGTMEKLHQVFASLGQTYGDLSLDLHCNRFGPTALFQICECPPLLTRLVVLNISGNRLTDACGSYLATILKSCKALYSLNVERCSITSRTIQKIADALDSDSVLSQLCVGYNNPITGNAISSLLSKLSVMKRFSELNLNGLKLSKSVVENLCHLAKIPSLSGLLLGETGIGNDGALQLTETLSSYTQELVKLDLSYCGLTSDYISKLSAHTNLISCVLELRICGNPIMQEGGDAIASLLRKSHCSLKVLVLSNCKLGLDGILHIIQALAENNSLEEVNLAENNIAVQKDFQYHLKEKEISENLQPVLGTDEKLPDLCTPEAVGPVRQGSSVMSADYSQLEVADSEDCALSKEPAVSGFDDSCASSSQKNDSECQYIRDISTAISIAKRLRLLDLSSNGISTQAVESLWLAWSSSSRSSVARRHVKSQVIHFSVDGKECCRVKSCCKKD